MRTVKVLPAFDTCDIQLFVQAEANLNYNDAYNLIDEEMQYVYGVKEVVTGRIWQVDYSKLKDGWLKSFANKYNIFSDFYILFTD